MTGHTPEQSPDLSPNRAAMRAARAPVGVGSAPLVAQLLALALVALGAVGIQEALVRAGAWKTSSWTSAVVDSVDGVRYDDPIVLVLSIVLAVLGLVLLPLGFKRRPRTSVALDATTGVYLRSRDLARVAATAVEGADSVTDVDVKAGRRTLKVQATTVASRDRKDEIAQDIRSRLTSSLDALERAPRLKVSVKTEGPSS